MILRIEDTDQNRFVEGAEKYIIDSLKWCGIKLDESVVDGGDFGRPKSPPSTTDSSNLIPHHFKESIIYFSAPSTNLF